MVVALFKMIFCGRTVVISSCEMDFLKVHQIQLSYKNSIPHIFLVRVYQIRCSVRTAGLHVVASERISLRRHWASGYNIDVVR